MRRIFLRLAWIVLGAIFALALLECVLRLLPVTMGPYRSDRTAVWPLHSSEPHTPYANSFSWSMLNAHRGVTNNYGHTAPFDYNKGGHPILVIGDSFIESLMNDYPDTMQAQLGQKTAPGQPVYGLGVSGLSASDYLALSRLARDEFNPVAAVFLINDGDLSESLGHHLGYYFLLPDGNQLKLNYAPLEGGTFPKRVRQLVGDISVYRYFQINLQFSLGNVFKVFRPPTDHPVTVAGPTVDIDRQRKVADWFLGELPTGLALPPECIVLLVDSDRYAIYNPESATARKDSPQARRYLIERAQALGFRVSDLDPVFRQHYAADKTKFDHWPIDRHWSRVGHGVGADEAYRLLFAPSPGHPQSCLAEKRSKN